MVQRVSIGFDGNDILLMFHSVPSGDVALEHDSCIGVAHIVLKSEALAVEVG